MMLAALSPIIGAVFSPFLAFKGGKGVATALGSVLGLSPSIGALLLLIWLGAVAIWRYSSGGALAAFGLFPVVAIVNEQQAISHFRDRRQHTDLDQTQGQYRAIGEKDGEKIGQKTLAA